MGDEAPAEEEPLLVADTHAVWDAIEDGSNRHSALNINQLINDDPDHVIQWLAKKGVTKLGEFKIKVFRQLHIVSMAFVQVTFFSDIPWHHCRGSHCTSDCPVAGHLAVHLLVSCDLQLVSHIMPFHATSCCNGPSCAHCLVDCVQDSTMFAALEQNPFVVMGSEYRDIDFERVWRVELERRLKCTKAQSTGEAASLAGPP